MLILSLWKTPVEKPVENVEKYEFSTAIPVICKVSTGANLCINRQNIITADRKSTNYVPVVMFRIWEEGTGKSWHFAKTPLFPAGLTQCCSQTFCENSTKTGQV